MIIIFSSFGFFFMLFFLLKNKKVDITKIKNEMLEMLVSLIMFYLNVHTNTDIFYDKHIKNYVDKIYKNLKIKNKIRRGMVEFIKDGIIIHECSKNEFICLEKDYLNYDFFVCTTDNNEKIIRTINDNFINNFDNKSDISDTKFIYCNLTITFIDNYKRTKNEKLEINLNDVDYNFYVVDNIINLNFIIYYLNYINQNLKNRFYMNFNEKNIVDYEMCIIDNDTNYVILNKNREMRFLKNKFLVGLDNKEESVCDESTKTEGSDFDNQETDNQETDDVE